MCIDLKPRTTLKIASLGLSVIVGLLIYFYYKIGNVNMPKLKIFYPEVYSFIKTNLIFYWINLSFYGGMIFLACRPGINFVWISLVQLLDVFFAVAITIYTLTNYGAVHAMSESDFEAEYNIAD